MMILKIYVGLWREQISSHEGHGKGFWVGALGLCRLTIDGICALLRQPLPVQTLFSPQTHADIC